MSDHSWEIFTGLFSDPETVPADRDTARALYPPLNAIDDEDVDLLLSDFRNPHSTLATDDVEDLDDLLHAWYATVALMNNPVSHDIVNNGINPDDYIETIVEDGYVILADTMTEEEIAERRAIARRREPAWADETDIPDDDLRNHADDL